MVAQANVSTRTKEPRGDSEDGMNFQADRQVGPLPVVFSTSFLYVEKLKGLLDNNNDDDRRRRQGFLCTQRALSGHWVAIGRVSWLAHEVNQGQTDIPGAISSSKMRGGY